MNAVQVFFPPERIYTLAEQILELIGYGHQTRAALLMGLPVAYTALMPGEMGPPRTALLNDLQMMNRRIRLKDGSDPMKVFLKNVVAFAGSLGDLAALRDALEDVEAMTTGTPRVVTKDLPEAKERIVFVDDMLPFSFIRAGLAAARSVARLAVPRIDAGVARMTGANPMLYLGTGWIIAPGLIVTNHHVLNARNEGEAVAAESDLRAQTVAATAWFDYDDPATAFVSVTLGELLAWDVKLDYAIARITIEDRAALPSATGPLRPVVTGQTYAVNIIQHPLGKPKKYAIRNNLVTAAEPTELRYFTDTLGGSSGSPVLDDNWRVLALHRGAASVRDVQFQGRDVAFVNVGTPIEAIFADLRTRYAGKLPELDI